VKHVRSDNAGADSDSVPPSPTTPGPSPSPFRRVRLQCRLRLGSISELPSAAVPRHQVHHVERALRHANYQNLHVLTRRTCTNKLQHHACFVIQRASNNRPRIKLSHSSNYFPAYLTLAHSTRSTCRKVLRTTCTLLAGGQQTLSRYRALFFVATTTTHFCLLLRSLLFSCRTRLNS